MFTLLRIVSSTAVSELYLYVLISFSHGYSAALAAKLIIKLNLKLEPTGRRGGPKTPKMAYSSENLPKK